MGEDIEWFEDEECDDTRIRTIEAYEVEQQLILYRKVIQRGGDYNFAMHVFRAIVTNYFPADYDYEAPLQTLRHRLYITLHALDRRFTGRRNARYRSALGTTLNPFGVLACAPCLVGAAIYGKVVLAGLSIMGMVILSQALPQSSSSGRPNMDFEEFLPAADEQIIGALVHHLQQQSLSGRRPLGLQANPNWGRQLPFVRSSILWKVRSAIGTLSPGEESVRDRQFMNIEYNKKALQAAIVSLREAAMVEQ